MCHIRKVVNENCWAHNIFSAGKWDLVTPWRKNIKVTLGFTYIRSNTPSQQLAPQIFWNSSTSSDPSYYLIQRCLYSYVFS
jgi:hypothetical protein